MKIDVDDLQALASAITPLDRPETRDAYRLGAFPRADRVKDLDRRYRWDLLHAAVPARFVTDLYDKGLHDGHIDTALRSIVPTLFEA